MKQQIIWLTTTLFLLMLVWGVRQSYAADAVVGDGSPESCTEAAFDNALVTASNGGGTITFDCGSAIKTINFTIAKTVMLGNVTINGNDRIILNANDIERHFFTGSGVTFQLQHITLRQGNSFVNGGAIEASGADVILEGVQLLNNQASVSGGAIYCFDGSLTIKNSLFENNSAETGGAIYNDGCVVEIEQSTFQNNQATALTGRGGAVHNSQPGMLTVNNSVFESNTALDGGGLYVSNGATAVLDSVGFITNSGGYGGGLENSGTLTMTNSLLDGNTVTGSGGGLWNIDGTAVVEQTTLIRNTAYEGGGVNSYGRHLQMTDVNIVDNVANGSHGGGIYHSGGTAFITNATISGNQATAASGNGGGIYQSSDDNLTLTNVTLVNNQAGFFGGGFYHYGRYAVLTNVTIGNNVAGAAGNAIYEDSPQTASNPGIIQMVNSAIFGAPVNCDGPSFQSLGHNMSQGSCSALSDPTDQDNYPNDLLLGNLALNGGLFPMQTILPLTGSPLIDAADSNYCPATDQRGTNREAICDIGATEYEAIVSHELYLPLVLR